MNRIISYLSSGCCHCKHRAWLEHCSEAAADVEAIMGGVAELIPQSPAGIVENGRQGVRLFVCHESDYLNPDTLAADVAIELRALADDLNAAAARLEGGAN